MLLETPACHFDKEMPDFSLRTPAGEIHTAERLMGKNGLMIAFICNHCPYVVSVIERLVADTKLLQEMGIGVGYVMSNDYVNYPFDAPDEMTLFTQKHGMTAPYLLDEDQTVARAFGAVCTPDVFGFNAKGGLQYRGRIDNLGMRGDQAGRVPELVNAMTLVAQTGTGPTVQSPSMGCSIKWR